MDMYDLNSFINSIPDNMSTAPAPPSKRMKTSKYRYSVGTKVSCFVGKVDEDDWWYGVITAVGKDEGEPAYQVELSSGKPFTVSEDTDEKIIKADESLDFGEMERSIYMFHHPDLSLKGRNPQDIFKTLVDNGWTEKENDTASAVAALKKLPVSCWSLFAIKSMLELTTERSGSAAANAGRAMALLQKSELKDKDKLLAHTHSLRALCLLDFGAPSAALADATRAHELAPKNIVYKDMKDYIANFHQSVEKKIKAKKDTEMAKTPVTILTGFLGSGKTTLLNYILREQKEKKYAVIENEFGAVGVDDALIRNKFKDEEDIIEMNNGCICCTVRGDLVKTLHKISAMIENGKSLDGVIIETTGMADPAPVAQTFFADDKVNNSFRIDAIITVVDCKWILQRLDEEKQGENEAVEQVAFADVVLLNKVDLVDAEHVKKVKSRIKGINASTKMIETKYSRVDLTKITDIASFTLDRVMANDEEFLNFDQEHEHDNSVSSVGVVLDGELSMDKFNDFIQYMMKNKGADLYRSKGVVAINGMSTKFVFQAVHMLLGGEPTDEWKVGEKRISRMIFIGKNLDEEAIRKGAQACVVRGSGEAAVEEAFTFGSGDGFKA